jgi:hypothetical protein
MANSQTSLFITVLSVSENRRQHDAQNCHEGAVGGCFERVRSGEEADRRRGSSKNEQEDGDLRG